MSMKINFQCPHCGEDGNQIEEVVAHVTQYSTVTDILGSSEATEVEYGDVEYDWANSTVQSYRCAHCCRELADDDGNVVDDKDSLTAWLQARNMLAQD